MTIKMGDRPTAREFIRMLAPGIILLITLSPLIYGCFASYGFYAYHWTTPVISVNMLNVLVTLYFAWIMLVGVFFGLPLTMDKENTELLK